MKHITSSAVVVGTLWVGRVGILRFVWFVLKWKFKSPGVLDLVQGIAG